MVDRTRLRRPHGGLRIRPPVGRNLRSAPDVRATSPTTAPRDTESVRYAARPRSGRAAGSQARVHGLRAVPTTLLRDPPGCGMAGAEYRPLVRADRYDLVLRGGA